MSAQCALCGAPSPDAYVDQHCGLKLAQRLTEAAGHAEDADAVISRQTRYGSGGQGGAGEPLPVDLTAADRLRAIGNTLTTWARVIAEETDGSIWVWMNNPAVEAAHWLAGRVDDLRQHPAADEAFKELNDACRDLERLVDRPADKELVGVCDCGKVLYAPKGRSTVRCPEPTCKLTWDVEQSRDVLRRHLGDKLVTAAEAARLVAYLDSDRTQDNIRKLIAARVKSGQIVAHGEFDGEETYRFSEVAALLATIPKRERRVA